MTLVKSTTAACQESARAGTSLIRRGLPGDAAALSEFATRTFIDTYADYPDQANLRRYAIDAFSEHRQALELVEPGATTLLAWRDDMLCGFARIRRDKPAANVAEKSAIELHRLYVDRRWHGRGVGPALLAQLRRMAAADGSTALWLNVWERNARAIAFYRKSGFIDVGVADFFVRDDRLTDRVLVLPLSPP